MHTSVQPPGKGFGLHPARSYSPGSFTEVTELLFKVIVNLLLQNMLGKSCLENV